MVRLFLEIVLGTIVAGVGWWALYRWRYRRWWRNRCCVCFTQFPNKDGLVEVAGDLLCPHCGTDEEIRARVPGWKGETQR